MAIDNKAPIKAPKRRVLLVSIPRTASNLLSKILNAHGQPNVHTNQKGGYFFYNAFMAAAEGGYLSKPGADWEQEEKTKIKAAFQACFDDLEAHSARAQEENKIMFAKEHAFWFFNPAALQKTVTGKYDSEFAKSFHVDIPEKYGAQTYSHSNETIMSDEYLRSWQLVFIIRHPALAWPSFYRAMIKMQGFGLVDDDGLRGSSITNMTMHWSRLMYDWAMEQPDAPVAPPIIDAHDLIHNPQIVLKLCEKTGLDPNSVQFEWSDRDDKRAQQWIPTDAVAEADKHLRAANIMLSTLQASSRPNKDLAPESIDIPAEAAKWKAEFGEEIASEIEKAVSDSMEDYEYLKARRLTV